MAVCLRIIHGIGQGQVLSLPGDQAITLGRSSQASYFFDDPLLSRKHCAIECRGNLCRVTDLQSRNGTYVNGQRLAQPVIVKAGDRIKIGSILMEIAPTGGPVPAAPGPPPVAAQPGAVLAPTGAPTQGPVPYPTAPAPYPTASPYGASPSPYAPGGAPDMGAYAGAQSETPQPIPLPPREALQPPVAPPPPPAAACEACRKPLGPTEARPFRGRVVCPRCLDRYDVDEGLIEGFQILERIAASASGTVYKARQTLMGRLVTLKTIATGAQTDQKSLRRFLREAKTGGRLSHPSIVELYDVNEQNDLMYIVMEFVDGETLDQILKSRGPLPAQEVVRYMGHIADALRYAHEQSIIHRDVRPATIIVRREDGRAKLGDFALSKNLERAAFSVITTDGEAIGTPYYMPPEQVKSAKSADARSDIYSFAATFYHVLSGRFPIDARSYGEFIAKVFTTDPTPLRESAPGVPAKLSALIMKALSRAPKDRQESMEALLAELQPIQKAVGAALSS